MKKYRVTGTMHVILQIDEEVQAQNEDEAHNSVADNSEWDCLEADLQCEEIRE